MARIGIYGGTFNPPHLGHLRALRAFAAALRLDRVLVIPDGQPPHKALAEESPDPETRLHLCRLAAEDLPFAEVSDLELRRTGKSYTAETVRALRRRFPGDRLFLLMGTDMFLSFDRWREPEAIAAEVTLVLAHRRSSPPEELAAIAAQRARLEEAIGAQVEILENDALDISSSEVRRLLCYRAGKTLLPEPVYAEILRRGLYRTGELLQNLPFPALRTASLSRHKEKRRAHALGCCETAQALARRWGADETAAARAGILHDVTKQLTGAEQLILCEEYGILVDDFSRKNEAVLHAVTGAAVAQRLFGESEPICAAIRWHTTGRAGMTRLEKILYLADMIEPNRDYPGVENLRRLAREDLDAAVRQALRRTIAFVEERGQLLHPDSEHALAYELERIHQTAPARAERNTVNE